jgi:hypothetical protein
MLHYFYYIGVDMIKGINGGKYISVSGGSPSTTYISPGSVGSGMLRYNGNMNCIEVNDGNMWKQMDMSYATITLDSETESILNWAKQERDKQRLREKRIQENPALKKAYEAILRAEENYDMLDRIVGDDVSSESEQVQASP